MNESIGNTPITIYGERAEQAFLFVHGQGGNRAEGERFARVAVPKGWQVLSVDLPEHGGRRDDAKFLPWEVVPELQAVLREMKTRWKHIGIRANSIGAWFSLLAFREERMEKCLLVSPLIDMEVMIAGMMRAAGVTEQRLAEEKEIATGWGQTLSWEYLQWARRHPVSAICETTDILRGAADEMIPQETIDRFMRDHACTLRVLPGGEHWFHTEEQLAFMQTWETDMLRS